MDIESHPVMQINPNAPAATSKLVVGLHWL